MGFSQCGQFSKRVYNYKSQNSIDPTLNQGYAKQLQKACPRDADPRVAVPGTFNKGKVFLERVPLDPASPLKFDNSFYKDL